jgi:regulatory protein
VRGHLDARGVAEEAAEAAVEALVEQDYLDDRRFTRRFAADRRALDSWGAERIERRLLELGVARELIADALAELGPEDELQAALELLERRFPEPPRDDRARNRALGLLIRRGYELELAHDAMRAHGRGGGAGR